MFELRKGIILASSAFDKYKDVEHWRKPMTTKQLKEFYNELYSFNDLKTEKCSIKIRKVSEIKVVPIECKESKAILSKYHYLPSHKVIGRQIRHQIIDRDSNELLAILIWGNTPAPSLEARDKYLGYEDKKERMKEICRVGANNLRFLILPYVKVPNLASRILSKSIKQLKIEWLNKYGDKLKFLETFVDPTYGFKGTCYLASSWKMIGYTKGYSFHGTRYFGLKGFQTMPRCNTKKMIFVKLL